MTDELAMYLDECSHVCIPVSWKEPLSAVVGGSEANDHCHGNSVHLSLAPSKKNWCIELYKVSRLL